MTKALKLLGLATGLILAVVLLASFFGRKKEVFDFEIIGDFPYFKGKNGF